jgi:hypothetical protein
VHEEKDTKQEEKVSESKEPRAILMAKRMKRESARKKAHTAKES